MNWPRDTSARDDARDDALYQQVKLLVRAERRLYASRIELDRQLARIRALNRFALEAGRSVDARWILERASTLLFELFPLDQAVACLAEGDRLCLAAIAAVPGREPQETVRLPDSRYFAPFPQDFFERPLAGPAREVAAQHACVEVPLGWMEALFGGSDRAAPSEALVLALPLLEKDRRPLGLLLARNPEPALISPHDRPPEEDDAGFLELVGSHLAAAVENARLHAELERRVAERTAELDANLRALREAQDQLLQAGKMAAVGTLVAGLSHELSKPLMVIHGYAEALLDEGPESPQAKKGLAAIARQARRCQDLVDALLDFSRKGPPQRDRVHTRDLVGRIAQLARSHPKCREVELRCEVAPEAEVEIFVNRSEIETALLNVVNNALEAAAPGTAVVLSVQGRDQRSEGDELQRGIEFLVADRGPGIPPEIRSRIFDPFFTTKPVGQGVGLGLSLTRQMIENHCGRVEVDSSPGQGTRVSLWVPRGEGPTPVVIE
ncbi:MAG: sensor histidine kinase [Deltaproteobacteria bacterium]|nr:MAG: sensor histidine kinase [Deltaproteobacteria bacterium]